MFGELVPPGGGDPVPLLQKKLLVGRRDSCDIALRFPNVSSRHCELELVSGYCDELVTVGIAGRGLFFAVSLYYDDFPQVSDDEVVSLLAGSERPPLGGSSS